jgi:hypothetical protein
VEREEEHEDLLIARKQKVALREPPGLHAGASVKQRRRQSLFCKKPPGFREFPREVENYTGLQCLMI